LKELTVALNASDDFVWTENELSPRAAEYCVRIELKLEDGQIYEVNIYAEDFVRRAAELLESGLLITVDYGAERDELLNDPNRFKGTLRSFRRHRFGEDVLSDPGAQDLTSTVDWTQVIEAGERNGFETLRLERLDKFLLAEGAVDELTNVAQTTNDVAELFNFNAGARELILPTGMASYFQVLVQRKKR
jgi:SAM-dependent MidA family methyltransferase